MRTTNAEPSGYRDYLKSDTWSRRRRFFYSRHLSRCFVCGYPRVQLHHCSYARLGAELDSDLVPLCSKHHRAVHALIKERRIPLAQAHFILRKKYRRNAKDSNDAVAISAIGKLESDERARRDKNRAERDARVQKEKAARVEAKKEARASDERLAEHRKERARSVIASRLGGIHLAIYEALPGTPAEISRAIGTSAVVVVSNLKKMEKADLVQRTKTGVLAADLSHVYHWERK